MNGDWTIFDEIANFQSPPGHLVGVIFIESFVNEEDFVPSDADDSLHATLCRLAGLPQPTEVKAIPRHTPRAPLQVIADMPQLAADLNEEYLQLVEAISS